MKAAGVVVSVSAGLTLSLLVCLPAASAAPDRTASSQARAQATRTQANIDWPVFLGRHDLVWKRVPTKWEEGAFFGNGLIGAVMYAPQGALSWELGRSDLTDHRAEPHPMRARARLPLGRMVLETPGPVTGIDARLDLWNAELGGSVTTASGSIRVRSFVHAVEPVLVVELSPGPGLSAQAMANVRFFYQPDIPINDRLLVRKQETIVAGDINPAPFVLERGGLRLSVQRRAGGGEHVVAWQERAVGGKRLLVVSVATSVADSSARAEAAAAVERAMAAGVDRLRRTHRAFWNGYYPQSFLSIPDTRLESFYWIQMYKLASATRADRPAIDTLGPWYHRTPWPGFWWNLNIQLSYWPVYTANRLDLGQSLLAIVDRNRDHLRDNVPVAMRADSMAVGRVSGPDAVSPVLIESAEQGPRERSNLIWTMHNYWLHYRHTMDQAMLRERLFPVLKASVTYVLRQLTADKDGRLHTPLAVSPEYPKLAPDTNYDHALLRWGLQTLLAIDQRLGLRDPESARWKDTLARLAPYPVGDTGYLIGRDQPLAVSHRHFSHLLMVYPLHLVTGERPEERALIEKSLAHWIGFEGALEGYSFVGASAISSLLGKGDDAHRYLGDLISRFVKPNTMYLESGPVIETPLAAAQAVHEMLLQSWGDTLRIFPAIPGAWKEAAFQDLRAEGAFLVSAARRLGRTTFVRVTSLAGEPVTLKAAMSNPTIATPRSQAVVRNADGSFRLTLAKGESVTLTEGEGAPAFGPVAPEPKQLNSFGLP
jgi:alpha-L-fucosidase 2